MTTEEVNEKLKDVGLKFDSYYKYEFTFIGTTEDGYEIICTYGGTSDMIYRFGVSSDSIERFLNVDNWTSTKVLKNNKEIYYRNNDF